MKKFEHLGQTIEAGHCDKAGPYVSYSLNAAGYMFRLNGGVWMACHIRGLIAPLEAIVATKSVEELNVFWQEQMYHFEGSPALK